MSSSAETSPSLISNLRCFRIQKKPTLNFSNENGTLNICELSNYKK